MNKTANYQLTIIVPVYNEEGNILRLEKELGEFLKDAKVSSCVLFVNDGSKDDSERLIREVCGRNEAFFFLNLARNGGLSAAMKAGIDNSFSRWSATLMQTFRQLHRILINCWSSWINTRWLWVFVPDGRIVSSRICLLA